MSQAPVAMTRVRKKQARRTKPAQGFLIKPFPMLCISRSRFRDAEVTADLSRKEPIDFGVPGHCRTPSVGWITPP
jgi:hypothetical protein